MSRFSMPLFYYLIRTSQSQELNSIKDYIFTWISNSNKFHVDDWSYEERAWSELSQWIRVVANVIECHCEAFSPNFNAGDTLLVFIFNSHIVRDESSKVKIVHNKGFYLLTTFCIFEIFVVALIRFSFEHQISPPIDFGWCLWFPTAT